MILENILQANDREIDKLKYQAKKLKKHYGFGYAQALDAIAKQYGFVAWALLMKTRNKNIVNKEG